MRGNKMKFNVIACHPYTAKGSYGCNMNCPFCYVPRKRTEKTKDYEFWYGLIPFFKQLTPQVAMEFKKESGGLYATTEKDRQEYNYVIEYVYPADLKDVKQKVVNRLEDTMFNQALVKISCEEEPSFNEDIIVEVY